MPDRLDTVLSGKGYGSTAQGIIQRLLANGMNIGCLRPWVGKDDRSYIANNAGEAVPIINAATLRKDEWKHYDTAILKVTQERLRGVADLYSRGLSYTIPNGMGSTVLEYENIGDMEDAQISMDGATRGDKDRPEFDIDYLPLPIVHKDFMINARVLAASRTTGAPLDTTMADMAGRKVAEELEDMLFNGANTYAYGGGTIYGYTDFLPRNTYSLTANWDTLDSSGLTGEDILSDVVGMKAASIADGFYGPWVLYIPTNFETAMDKDFKSNSDKSIRTRLLEIDGLEDIRVADKLTADNVIMVQMTSDVVRMVNGMAVNPVEWNTEGGMILHYKVMTIQVPQIRADQDGKCGIVHGS